MAKKTIPKPWRVADGSFVDIEIARPADTRMRVEFECGLRVVIAVEAHDPAHAHAHTRERNRLTILYDDRTGVCVLTKRLETGTFAPSASRPSAGPQPTAGTTRPDHVKGSHLPRLRPIRDGVALALTVEGLPPP